MTKTESTEIRAAIKANRQASLDFKASLGEKSGLELEALIAYLKFKGTETKQSVETTRKRLGEIREQLWALEAEAINIEDQLDAVYAEFGERSN